MPGFEEIVKEYYTDHGSFFSTDSGLDLFCLEDLVIPPRAYSVKMPLGICMEACYTVDRMWHDTSSGKTGGKTVKHNTGFYLYPRSSTGSKTPIRLSNSVGIIDSDYRGELMAFLDNVSDEPFTMKKGERYFQVCTPYLQPFRSKLVETLSESERCEGGFGSTGK